MTAEEMLLWLRDNCADDCTVHTIKGWDGDNQFCVHPNGDPDDEYRAPTLDGALRRAVKAVAERQNLST